MEKGDKTSPSIILAGRALFVKMFITLEPRYAFCSFFECHFIYFNSSFLFVSSFFYSFFNTYVD